MIINTYDFLELSKYSNAIILIYKNSLKLKIILNYNPYSSNSKSLYNTD